MRSYIKEKLVWIPSASSEPIELNYIMDYSDNETTEPVNNKATIKLVDAEGVLTRSGVFLPEEGDVMHFYSKEVVDSNTEFTANDIIWTGIYVDKKSSESNQDKTYTLSVLDLGIVIFNRFWAKPYTFENKRTNEIVIDIIENLSENIEGYGTYTIDTSNIVSTRNDGSPFPIVEPIFINKPVYEWLSELSLPEWTNSEEEILGNEVIKESMVFKILGTKAYWYEQPTTASFIVTDNTYILNMSEQSENEGEVSYLILECGEDFNSKPIYVYLDNDDASSKITKERYENIPKIAGQNDEYDNEYHNLRAQYTIDTNTEFRQEVRKLASSRQDYFFEKYGKGKNKISLTLPMTDTIEVGQLINIQRSGYKKGLYKIITKSNKSNSTSRTTTFSLEYSKPFV